MMTARSKDETEKGLSESDSNYVKLPKITGDKDKGAFQGMVELSKLGIVEKNIELNIIKAALDVNMD